MSGKRSGSESDVSESSATVKADEVKALVSITNNRGSNPRLPKSLFKGASLTLREAGGNRARQVAARPSSSDP